MRILSMRKTASFFHIEYTQEIIYFILSIDQTGIVISLVTTIILNYTE